jgi:hypothetical protein
MSATESTATVPAAAPTMTAASATAAVSKYSHRQCC